MATLTNLTAGDKLRLAGHAANLLLQGRTVTVAAGSFQALVSEGTEIDPDAPLGPDPREVLIIEARKDKVPDTLLELRADSQVAGTINGTAVTITKRTSDPASPFVKFEAVNDA